VLVCKGTQDWQGQDWNLRHKRGQKCRVESARLEKGAPKSQGWKMRENKLGLRVWLM